MDKTTFVVSDDSVNSYGFVIRTAGIETARFERNPVMLYMHERKTVVGRWENIRKEGKKLLANAVFDDTTELGSTVKAQVEKGFLRSASIGVDILESKREGDVEVVTKCVLTEISIVDIPANGNALKLYHKGGRRMLRPAVHGEKKDLKTAVCELLGLRPDVPDEVIIAEIQDLTAGARDEAAIQVDEAVKAGYIDPNARRDFITMARVSPGAYSSYMTNERNKRDKAIKTAVEESLRVGRINRTSVALYCEIGQIIGPDRLGELFAQMPKRVKLSEIIAGGDKSGWTLSDYRLYAPDELRKNPGLFARLLKEEEERSGTSGHSLEYYRRNDPEYLREHPELYKKLIDNL